MRRARRRRSPVSGVRTCVPAYVGGARARARLSGRQGVLLARENGDDDDDDEELDGMREQMPVVRSHRTGSLSRDENVEHANGCDGNNNNSSRSSRSQHILSHSRTRRTVHVTRLCEIEPRGQ